MGNQPSTTRSPASETTCEPLSGGWCSGRLYSTGFLTGLERQLVRFWRLAVIGWSLFSAQVGDENRESSGNKRDAIRGSSCDEKRDFVAARERPLTGILPAGNYRGGMRISRLRQ